MNTRLNSTRLAGFGLTASIAAMASLITACASMAPPTDDLALSTAAVAQAASAGGTELAPLPMRSARERLDRANLAMAAKDYESAQRLAREARVDAQLAQASADSAKARKAAEALREDTRVLREEIGRKNDK